MNGSDLERRKERPFPVRTGHSYRLLMALPNGISRRLRHRGCRLRRQLNLTTNTVSVPTPDMIHVHARTIQRGYRRSTAIRATDSDCWPQHVPLLHEKPFWSPACKRAPSNCCLGFCSANSFERASKHCTLLCVLDRVIWAAFLPILSRQGSDEKGGE